MPPAKRSLADSDSDSQPDAERPAKNAKMSSSTTDASKTRTDIKTKFLETPFEGAYEYVCFEPPDWSKEDGDEDDEDDSEEEDEDEEEEKSKDKMFDKPAKDHPGYKHVFTKATLELLSDNCKEAVQRDPDMFGMYVYNDFVNYAVLDLIEELVGRNLHTGLVT